MVHQPARRGHAVWAWWRRRRAPLLAAGMLACGLAACGGTADESKLPPNVQDPATLKTPSGAVARYRGVLLQFPTAVDRAVTAGAIITDELAALRTPINVIGKYTPVDSRTDLSALSAPSFDRLHRVRGQAHEARGFVAAYAPDSSPALQGHLAAVEAYAEVLLADLFCSGIPLSTIDFDGNYTTTPGFTTAEVYRHASALFDSALALTADSIRFQHLAAVGKGRALLALGEYAAAAAAVSAVPDDYTYQVAIAIPPFGYDLTTAPPDSASLWFFAAAYNSLSGIPSAADGEGTNGLDYRTSGDPRTAVTALGTGLLGDSMYFPLKYPQSGTATFTVASGIEARLIEAEAALQASPEDGQWLAKLNHLRQTMWSAITPLPAEPLPDLADPGDAAARENLLFRERAFWLYLTAHRQGDLRRLVRDYGRKPEDVYPTGPYPGGAVPYYGAQIVIPPPPSERELNPQYAGCFRDTA